VAQSSNGPMTCITSVIRCGMLKYQHVFGGQGAVFNGIHPSPDLVLVIRLYSNSDITDVSVTDDSSFSLVAWAALPLVVQGSICLLDCLYSSVVLQPLYYYVRLKKNGILEKESLSGLPCCCVFFLVDFDGTFHISVT
jgi:hypothetical protein